MLSMGLSQPPIELSKSSSRNGRAILWSGSDFCDARVDLLRDRGSEFGKSGHMPIESQDCELSSARSLSRLSSQGNEDGAIVKFCDVNG